jgi:hypothetical protein
MAKALWRGTVKGRTLFGTLTLVLVVSLALVGCKAAEPTPTPQVGFGGPQAGPGGGLGRADGLALGTLRLEGTGDAVTPAQAAALLPLWQMIQGSSLQSDAETQAVLKQIESQMSEAQLAAIEAMSLTWEDVGAWMQEQGIEMPAPPAGQQDQGAEVPAPPSGQQGGPGAFQNLSEDERTKLRQEFQNMGPEQRSTRMAEMGIQRPEGEGQGRAPGFGAGRLGGRSSVLLDPLIALLAERAAQ